MGGGSLMLKTLTDNYANYISTKEFRLPDGTLARNRPQKNTIWLDDLYMSVPALAQMGNYRGEQKYYDDAVKQVLQFSRRMFHKDKGLFQHGWVEEMDIHPAFFWARANGWALLAMTELLDVLPRQHKGYDAVLAQYRSHCEGLLPYQSGTGFWHQLLDKKDSYLETSATGIFQTGNKALQGRDRECLFYRPPVFHLREVLVVAGLLLNNLNGRNISGNRQHAPAKAGYSFFLDADLR